MKKVFVFGLIVLLLAGVAFAKGYEVKKKAGEYDVEATIDRNPPAMGKNNMEVRVTDKAGKAVTDAKVLVEYGMPAMPGMHPMNYRTDASLSGEVYKAVLNVSMAGPWYVNVKISRVGNKTETAKFTFDVR
jgi:YtkA-like